MTSLATSQDYLSQVACRMVTTHEEKSPASSNLKFRVASRKSSNCTASELLGNRTWHVPSLVPTLSSLLGILVTFSIIRFCFLSLCCDTTVKMGEQAKSELVEKSALETSGGGPDLKAISKRLRAFNKKIKRAEEIEAIKATGKEINEQQVLSSSHLQYWVGAGLSATVAVRNPFVV